MDNNKFNPALGISNFFPDDVASENFLLFLKAYYEWLQTTHISFSGITGTFVRDEIVVGETSGATGIIKEVKTDGSIIIRSTSTISFDRYENVTGQTSNAVGISSGIKDNVVRKSGKLLDYRTIDNSVDKYVDFLKEELYDNIPKNVYGNARDIALRYKDLYQSKSNEESYRFLLKHLYGQNSEFYYPGTDLLRISDGKFEKTKIIRAAINPQIFSYINKTVVGKSSGALGNVVDIRKFFLGSIEIAEMTLTLVDGVFTAGETIEVLNDESIANTSVYGMVTGFTLNDSGSGYAVGDNVSISGDGKEAQATVASIKQSPITAFKVNSVGYGYQLNTTATINNAGTGGSGLIIRVTGLANTYNVTSGSNTYTVGEVSEISIINRGSNYYKKPSVTLEDAVVSSLGLLSENLITINNAGTNYGVGNTLIFTGGSGSNAAGIVASVVETTTYDLKFEDDTKMIAETGKDIIKNEDWNVKGPISRIELTNYGSGYTPTSLPTITVSTTTGSSANLVATNIQGKSANVTIDVANNATGIGSIREIIVKDFGIGYTTATSNVNSYGDGNANLTPIISGLGVKEGNWISDDGKVNYKKIQDSYYYQDFSYVIKSGLVFNAYKDTIKKLLHPAGLQAFGELLLSTKIEVEADIIFKSQTIREYIVSIHNEFLTDAQIITSTFHWEQKVKTFKDISSPLLDDTTTNRRYELKLVPGGNPSKSVSNVSPSLSEWMTVSLPLKTDPSVTSGTTSGKTNIQFKPVMNVKHGYEISLGESKLYQSSTKNFYEHFRESEFVADIDYANATFNTYFETEKEITGRYTKIKPVISNDLSSTSNYKRLDLIFNSVQDSSANIPADKYEVRSRAFHDISSDAGKTVSALQYRLHGTANSLTSTYGDVEVNFYRDLPIADAYLLEDTFSDPASVVIGTETEFSTDFHHGSKFIADSQLFDVDSVANNTHMIVNVPALPGYVNQRLYSPMNFIVPVTLTSANAANVVSMLSETSIDLRQYNRVKVQFKNALDMSTAEIPSKFGLSYKTRVIQAYDTTYGDIKTKDISTLSFEDFIPGGAGNTIAQEQFDTLYPTIVNSSTYIKYTKVTGYDGTVASATPTFGDLPLSSYSATTLYSIRERGFSELAPVVIGTGPVDFVRDFVLGDVFVANNEYFTVQSIANTTYMITDRLPINQFSGVTAYKISA
jgi:hypothetical protein